MMPAIIGAHMPAMAFLRSNVFANDLQSMWRAEHVGVGNGMTLVGIPCSHAISAILYHGGNPIDYLSHYYSKVNYLKTYQPIIYPVPSEEQWPRSNQPIIEPPKTRVAPGRPRKVRIRGDEEPKKSKHNQERGKQKPVWAM
jgi:hypothetical protein